MKSYVCFKLKSGNHYLYSLPNKELIYLHPVMKHLVKVHEQETNELCTKKKDKEYSENANKIIEKSYSKNEIIYQTRKFNFLKKNGYFDNNYKSTINQLGLMQGDQIQSYLANTRQVTFEVTENCNLRCTYCGLGKLYNNHDLRFHRRMNFSMAKTMIDYLIPFWNSNLNSSKNRGIKFGFYGGEPLMNIDLIEQIIEYVGKQEFRNNFITYGLTTNGTYLEKYRDFLFENDFELLISLDGDDKSNVHRTMKNGKNSFYKIMRNIESLQNKYPTYFDSKVNFISVLNNENSIIDIYKFFKRRFNKFPIIIYLNPYGINPEFESLFNKIYKDKSVSIDNIYKEKDLKADYLTEEVKQKNDADILTGFINNHSKYTFTDLIELLMNSDKLPVLPTGTCMPFSRNIYVTVNGKILPCEKIGHNFPLGNIKNGSVKIDFQNISELYNKSFQYLHKQCQECYVNESCPHCIFNLADACSKRLEEIECFMKIDYDKYKSFMMKNLELIEEIPSLYSTIVKETVLL
jgi:uncharacterized protein